MVESKKDLHDLELFIAKLLRYGVLLAGILMFIGWMSQISFDTDTLSLYKVYHGEHLFEVLREAWATGKWGLLTSYAGLAVLISLPLIRVFATGLIFIKQKDFIMAAVVGVVLFGLLLSLSLGFDI